MIFEFCVGWYFPCIGIAKSEIVRALVQRLRKHDARTTMEDVSRGSCYFLVSSCSWVIACFGGDASMRRIPFRHAVKFEICGRGLEGCDKFCLAHGKGSELQGL